MGRLSNFREVIKELKHKELDEETIKLCPKCGSKKIAYNSLSAYPGLYGMAPRKYVCPECGYNGPLVMEQTKTKEEKEES
jgi:ssDNA-binding Zn-finger/Zn-ribbon topoisomerase 1